MQSAATGTTDVSAWDAFTGQRAIGLIPYIAVGTDQLLGSIKGQRSTKIRDGVYKAYEQFGPFLDRFRTQLIPIAKEKYKAAEERRAKKSK